jgi:hypothetical protein
MATIGTEENAARLREWVGHQAAQAMPAPVVLEVVEATLHASSGAVVCLLEGRKVRCVAPVAWDMSVGRHILLALPFTGKAESAEYVAILWLLNGNEGSRAPSMMMAGGEFQPSSQSTPDQGARLHANDEGQLLATSQNGTDMVVNDDTVQWLNYLA